MRRLAWILPVLLLAGPRGVDAAPPRSPWPDPEERSAFQREELTRRSRHPFSARARGARDALQDRFDARFYRLDLDLRDLTNRWIVGRLDAALEVTAGPLDTLLLDLDETMTVDSVLIDGVRADFSHEMIDLSVPLADPRPDGEQLAVSVFYQGHPAQTGFNAFGWGSHDGTVVIWSLSEPIGAREWWPCKDRPDDKADSVEVIIRVPDWMIATSNGLLVDQRDEGDFSRSFRWKHRYPITTYLVSVTATDFERLTDSTTSIAGPVVPIEHFVYPEKLAAAAEDFSITPEALRVLEERFGPYPFLEEKYGHTLCPFGGAMEHQTNTSFGAGLVTGAHYGDWVLVHELAHQWWGDMTSPADWRDIWLNEGFASYAEALWFESRGGASDYRSYMVDHQIVIDPSGPVYDPDALFDGNTVYNKGAWVLHMLRGVLGDSLFYAALAEYRERTAYRSTTTEEFQSIVEEVGERELDWFFQPWLHGVNRPEYVVSFLPFTEGGRSKVAVHIDQAQKEAPFFPMPIALAIQLSGGVSRARVWNDEDHQDFELSLPLPATGVTLDPDSWILKRTTSSPYPLSITTTDLPRGTRDSLYVTALRGRGGQPPYRWSALDALPPGLELGVETGVLRGTAPAEGSYTFSVRLADAGQANDTQRYRWQVGAFPDTTVTPPDTTGTVVFDDALRAFPIPARDRLTLLVAPAPGVRVVLEVFDLQGRRVRRLHEGTGSPGEVLWDGRSERGDRVASGIYLARVQLGPRTATRRLVWLWGR